MAARKQFLGVGPADPELMKLMDERRGTRATEDELQEQRISYAYGNALESDGVTKETVRATSQSIKLIA
jgi:hypothetical protein